MPDGRYTVKSFAADDERKQTFCAYAVFSGTHTGQGWPSPTDRQEREHGLCVRHGVRRRQNPAYGENLECRMGP